MSKLDLQHYTKATAALNALGYDQTPALADIQAAFTPKQLAYADKHDARLVLTPPSSFYELLWAFDKKQPTKSYVYKELWDQYDLSSTKWRADFVLPELMFTNQTYEEQKASLNKFTKNLAGLQSVDPRSYLMLSAIRREQDEPPLDQSTFTRFVQLPKKTSGGGSWVARVNSFGGQVHLGRSGGGARSDGGLRASVGLELSTSASAIPSFSSSATALQELTKALNRHSDLIEKVFKV